VRVGVPCFGGDAGRSGIGRYIIQLLGEFADADQEWQFDVPVHISEQDAYLPDHGPLKALPVGEGVRNPLLNVAWHQIVLPRMAHQLGWDVLLLPAGNRRLPVAAPCPMVGVVHDMSSIHVAAKYDPARMFYIKRVLPFLFRRLTMVISPSKSTRKDLIEYAALPPERIRVIPLGVDHERFRPRNPETARKRMAKRYGLKHPFILYVSRIEHPGKNHAGLIRAFRRMKKEYNGPLQLVLAGSDWSRAREVHRMAEASGCAHDIVFTGFVDSVDLPDLYSASRAVVFPSLYEGFGLPVLEAMASGAPVACSDRSSLPEVAGDAALLFDPEDDSAMADAMTRLVDDETLVARLHDAGIARSREYSWERTARETLDCIREAASSS